MHWQWSGGRIDNVNSTSFTIGQPIVGTISNGNTIHQGFQQPSFMIGVPGCMDSTMFNYNPLANTDDGSCIPFYMVVRILQLLTTMCSKYR